MIKCKLEETINYMFYQNNNFQELLSNIKFIKCMVYHKLALKQAFHDFLLSNAVYIKDYEKIIFPKTDD